MPTSYTSLLGLALPVQGELTGTWGDTVNDYITKYVDASVAGTQTISGSQTAVTLSTTTGSTLSQAGSGATGSSQYMIINCTGNPAGLLTITAPATSKMYVVINGTSTAQSVKIVGPGPTTGVTVLSGDKALVAWNGTDFVRVGASAGGSNTQVQYNNGGNLAGSANLTFDGTTLTSNALTLTNALTVANGGTGLNTTTAYGLIAAGTTATGNFQQVSGTGSSGQVLTSNGASSLPTWQTLSSPSQASGALIVNTTTVGVNYTLPSGSNAFSVGPITISSGYAITVTSGQRWVVV